MSLSLYHLSSAYDHFSDPIVKEFYIKALECKIDGFSSVYGDVNPIDSTEIICDHFMYCLPTNKGLEVISTFKVLTNRQAKRFNMSPPCFSLINTIKDSDQKRKLKGSLERYYLEKEKSGKDSCYMYAWTISKKYRNTPLGDEIKRLTLSTLRHYTVENNNCGATIVGMKKVKTDKMLESIGFEPLADNENIKIKHFLSPLYDNTQALLMSLNNWSPEFVKKSNKDLAFYENRIILGEVGPSRVKQVA